MSETFDSEVTGAATTWLSYFEAALAEANPETLSKLFLDESYWRDMLAFTWDVTQFHGRDAVLHELLARIDVKPRQFVVDPDRSPPRAATLGDRAVVEFFIRFETEVGAARGMVVAVRTDGDVHGLRALVLFTQLVSLVGGEPKALETRQPGLGYEPAWPGQSYGDYRRGRAEYAAHSPDVLIVGGGQAGAMLAAHLGQLGVDALVVDKHARPGDGWRERYDSLALHTYTDMSNLPFFPFPRPLPQYLPKDRFADYLEAYVNLMDLTYWTSSEFLSAEFDEESLAWTARVRRGDEIRVLRPKHIAVCVGGAGGRPRLPSLPGLDSFEGTVLHSSQFKSAGEYAGARAMVVGVGTSAHDIALDLFHHGCDVQMIQRGSTTVLDVEVANVVFADFVDPKIPQDEADLRSSARAIYPLLVDRLRDYTQWTNDANAELLEGLERAGMRLDVGEDGTGWQMKFIRYAGGYYLNVGASDVIVAGGIKVRQYDELDRFTPEGVVMRDGTVGELDLVVLATGYERLTSEVRALFGDEVADRVGQIAGLAEDGERRNFARVTPQPHLWFTFGGISEGRRATPALALQLKANLMGAVPTLVRGPDMRIKAFGG